MKTYRKIITAAVLMLSLCSSMQAQITTRRKTLRDNERLRTVVDSLRRQLDSCKLQLARFDSLASEMMEVYEDEEVVVAQEQAPMSTDSLLSIWYLQRRMNSMPDTAAYDLDSVHLTSNVPDSVLISRLSKMNSYITLPFNETVKNYMVLYAEKMPAKMGTILGLSTYYFPIFEEVFSRYNLPLELKYMAVVESALNPTAYSRAGARGPWQFIYSTARNYGLKINSFVDERMNVEKATDAAARYLSDAYRIFGDWALAISSYNCGAGNVNKAIKRSGGKKDFWSIYPYLPRETRGYMPAFVGAMYAMTYYRECGLVPDECSLPAACDTFYVHKNLHFSQINEVIGVPMQTLKDLNPEYKNNIIPGNEGECILRLPYDYSGEFIEHQDTLYTHRSSELLSEKVMKEVKDGSSNRVVYRVKSGDYLGKIARKYHVSVAQLKKWNGLRSDNLRIGQVLYIHSK
jgi:membrane-bound lytic murein transglycosylase D